jgi:hypothetical protein
MALTDLFRRRPRPTPEGEPTLTLEREGQARIDEVAKAARELPWVYNLVQLAWTAGPVTFIAAVGGYFVGYGKTPSTDYLIFFVTYAVIAGLGGILARFAYNALYAPRKRAAARDLALVNDLLPDIAFEVRNLYLAAMEPDLRRQWAAGMLLRHLDLSPASVAVAVEELTQRRTLADAVMRIEVFRRAGLRSRVDEVIATVADEAAEALETLSQDAPDLVPLLRDRLEGRSLRPEDGMPREEGFIERVMSAAEHEDEALMTVTDVLEMLVLAFELINGREFPMLTFTHRGHWELAQTTDTLERRHNRYRAAKLKGYSRLKALVALLASSELADLAGPPAGQDTATLLAAAKEAIGQLNDQVDRLGRRVAAGREAEWPDLRRCLHLLGQVVHLNDAMERAFRSVGRRHAVFLHTLKEWEGLSRKAIRDGRTLRTGGGAKGLRLVERRLALEDRDKLAVAHDLAEYLRGDRIRLSGNGVVMGRPGHERPLDLDAAKRLAMLVASTLANAIDLAQPEVQRAIDTARAANLTGLEPGTSAQLKAGVAAAMIAEVEDHLDRAAERVATRLVYRYGVTLDGPAVDFLHRHYGARRERLELLAARKHRTPYPFTSPLATRPPLDPTRDPAWRGQIERSRLLLERYGKEG